MNALYKMYFIGIHVEYNKTVEFTFFETSQLKYIRAYLKEKVHYNL